MCEIGSGIRVYFENKKEFRNVVFFPDDSYSYYSTGGMLFELIRDDAIYMLTTKVENMIKAFPDYGVDVSVAHVTDGFKWLYGTIEDEELPVATELFRGCFNEVIHDVAAVPESYACVGEFFTRCFEEYRSHIEAFAVYVDAIAAYNSGVADNFQAQVAEAFIESAEELNDLYTRKCSVRQKNGTVSVDTVQITNFLQILTFEYCRMKKEHKPLKICENCGRYFIPVNRSDSKYCSATSPQNPAKACIEVGANFRHAEMRRNDPVEREHHNNSCRLYNVVRRQRESGATDEQVARYVKELQEEKKKYLSEKYPDGGTAK